MALTKEQIDAAARENLQNKEYMDKLKGRTTAPDQTLDKSYYERRRRELMKTKEPKRVTTYAGIPTGGVAVPLGEEVPKKKGRLQKTKEIFQRQFAVEQTAPESIMQLFGQGAGAVLDVYGKGMELVQKGMEKAAEKGIEKGIIPLEETKVEKAIKKPIQKVAQSKPVKAGLAAAAKGAEAYKQWAEKNPRWAADVEAVGNIISLYPAVGATKVAKGMAKKGAIAAAETRTGKLLGAVKEELITKPKLRLEAEKAEQKAFRAITPDTASIPTGEYDKLRRAGRITEKSGLQPAQYVLSEEEAGLARKYQKLLQSDDPIANTNSVLNNLNRTNSKVSPLVKANNKPLNRNELTDNMLKEMMKVAEKDMDVKDKDIVRMVNDYQKFLKKGDIEELFENRNQFTTSKTYEGLPTTQREMEKAARRGIVKTLKNNLPKEYSSYMDEMHDMFEIADLLEYSAKSEKGKNSIQVWIKNNPAKAKAIGFGAGTVGVGLGWEMLK